MIINKYYNEIEKRYKYYWLGTDYDATDHFKKVAATINFILMLRGYDFVEQLCIFNYDFEKICKRGKWNVLNEQLVTDEEFKQDYMVYLEEMRNNGQN